MITIVLSLATMALVTGTASICYPFLPGSSLITRFLVSLSPSFYSLSPCCGCHQCAVVVLRGVGGDSEPFPTRLRLSFAASPCSQTQMLRETLIAYLWHWKFMPDLKKAQHKDPFEDMTQ